MSHSFYFLNLLLVSRSVWLSVNSKAHLVHQQDTCLSRERTTIIRAWRKTFMPTFLHLLCEGDGPGSWVVKNPAHDCFCIPWHFEHTLFGVPYRRLNIMVPLWAWLKSDCLFALWVCLVFFFALFSLSTRLKQLVIIFDYQADDEIIGKYCNLNFIISLNLLYIIFCFCLK